MKRLDNINDWTDCKEHQKLGEILLQAGKLNLIHLGMALDVQRFEDDKFGEILLDMKVIDEDELDMALQLQKDIDIMLRQRK